VSSNNNNKTIALLLRMVAMAQLLMVASLIFSTSSTTTTAFVVAPNCVVGRLGVMTTTTTSALLSIVTGPSGRAATSFEEDLQLTLQIIRDHEARSTTVSTEQFIQQEQKNAVAATAAIATETVDIAVPYDAAARLAYQRANVPTDYAVFREQYEAEAIAMVTAKKAAAAAAAAALARTAAIPAITAVAVPVTVEAKTTTTVDLSVPYDAAARLAFATATTILSWEDFKLFFETEAIASVVAKRAAARESSTTPAVAVTAVDVSVPYDAAARLAYANQIDKTLPYEEFKAQFQAQAIQDVMAKRAAPTTTHAATATSALTNDISVPYDAAARLAFASQTDNSLPYDEFKVQFEAQAVRDVITKRVGTPTTDAATTTTALTNDVSVPYDAAARLAYASQTNNALPYDEFKVQFETQAIQDVMAKRVVAQSA
jgi:hypothetical protein